MFLSAFCMYVVPPAKFYTFERTSQMKELTLVSLLSIFADEDVCKKLMKQFL